MLPVLREGLHILIDSSPIFQILLVQLVLQSLVRAAVTRGELIPITDLIPLNQNPEPRGPPKVAFFANQPERLILFANPTQEEGNWPSVEVERQHCQSLEYQILSRPESKRTYALFLLSWR